METKKKKDEKDHMDSFDYQDGFCIEEVYDQD